MNRSEQEHTRILRAWLDEGTTELSPRVHDAVLREFPATTQDRPFWSSGRTRISAYATVAAAAAVVVMAALIGYRLLAPGTAPGGAPPTGVPSASDAPSPTPEPIDRSYRDVGFIGLPPPGAVPSDPERTDLVESFWLPRNVGGPFYRGAVFVYADGRMIWNEYSGSPPSTGWLEQRLTAEGIDLVRGLGVQTSELDVPRKLDPALLPGLLPASAWADRTVRPYVPSGFAACLVYENWGDPWAPGSITLTQKLALLPDAARELLEDHERAAQLPKAVYDDSTPCFAMSTADARQLDAVLRNAGLEQDEGRNGSLLEYHVVLDVDAPEAWRLGVWFEPILPDGTITCSSCG